MAWNIEGFDAPTFKEFARRLQAQLKSGNPPLELPLHALHEAMARTLKHPNWHEAELALTQLPAKTPTTASWMEPLVHETTHMFQALMMTMGFRGPLSMRPLTPLKLPDPDWGQLFLQGPEAVKSALAEWHPLIDDLDGPNLPHGGMVLARLSLDWLLVMAERSLDRAPPADRAVWSEVARTALAHLPLSYGWHGLAPTEGTLAFKAAFASADPSAWPTYMAAQRPNKERGFHTSLSFGRHLPWQTQLTPAFEFAWASGSPQRLPRIQEMAQQKVGQMDLVALMFRTADPAVAALVSDEMVREVGQVAWGQVRPPAQNPAIQGDPARALSMAMEKGLDKLQHPESFIIDLLKWGTLPEIQVTLARWPDPGPWAKAFTYTQERGLHPSEIPESPSGHATPPPEALRAILAAGVRLPLDNRPFWKSVVKACAKAPAVLTEVLVAHAVAPQDPLWMTLFEGMLARPGAPLMDALEAAGGDWKFWAKGPSGGRLLAAAIQGKNTEWLSRMLAAGAPWQACPGFNGDLLKGVVGLSELDPFNTRVSPEKRGAAMDLVKALLDGGVDPDEDALGEGRTALYMASNPEVAELLLNRGASLNRWDRYGDSPVTHWCQHHRQDDSLYTMLDLALKNGLDVNQVAPHGTHRSKGRALLHRAVANDPNARMVKWLLAHGADPSAKDHAGCTPMALLSKHPAYVAEEVRALLVEALALRQGPSEATPQAETKSDPAPKPRRP